MCLGVVLFVGDPTVVAPAFDSVTRVGAMDNDVRVTNLVQGTPIFLLEGRIRAWAEIWPRIRHL